jgi:hypothetical protein
VSETKQSRATAAATTTTAVERKTEDWRWAEDLLHGLQDDVMEEKTLEKTRKKN